MRNFKVGRFVNTQDGVGVVHSTQEMPIITVHLIDKNGETRAEKKYNIVDLTLTDVPLPSRVATPSY